METEVCFVGMGNCLGWVLRERVRDFYAARGIESESVHTSKMEKVKHIPAAFGEYYTHERCDCESLLIFFRDSFRDPAGHKIKQSCFTCGRVMELQPKKRRSWHEI